MHVLNIDRQNRFIALKIKSFIEQIHLVGSIFPSLARMLLTPSESSGASLSLCPTFNFC